MTRFKPEEYEARNSQLEGWPVCIASYRLGHRYSCRVDNVSPGATIARGVGDTRQQAEEHAVLHAAGKLRLTRRLKVGRGLDSS